LAVLEKHLSPCASRFYPQVVVPLGLLFNFPPS
jgi:hypothetical protein